MGISPATIVDGYNLLHTLGVMRANLGPGGLERARTALLNCLADALDPPARAAMVVVFDARTPPADAAPVTQHRGITVRYAAGYEDADALIQELIRRHSAPKRLTVVSSDRAVQQAATRRRARAIGSEVWYEELLSRRPKRSAAASAAEDAKPAAPLAPEQVELWLSEFDASVVTAESASLTDVPQADRDDSVPPDVAATDDKARDDYGDPFPPGYLEQIERELRSGES